MIAALLLGCSLVVTGAAKPAEADRAAYESARASAGRDADAHVALALWCEAHGMPSEKATHLARAVLLDPSHAKARGLLGYVKHDGKWMRPEEVSKAVAESPEAQALFREYQQRRIKARDRADDQYKLAQWCDEHGLEQQATAHYRRVVELDHGREGAWRRMGFKKISGRWTKPEILAAEKAEREARAKADKLWKPRLEHLKDALSGRDKAKKAEAEQALAAIADPRAVPMVWKVFAQGDERWQRVALQLLSQIDSPESSVGLATMAVFHPSADMRSQASQVLLHRSPRSYAAMLVGLLRDEVEYEARPVRGPGSQGELRIKGKDVNVNRVYRPMQPPPAVPPGWLSVDDYGFAVVKLYLGSYTSQITGNTPLTPVVPGSASLAQAVPQLAPILQKAGMQTQAPVASATQTVVTPTRGVWNAEGRGNFWAPTITRDSYSQTITTDVTANIPIGWMMMQARESAAVAQEQLAADVREIEAYNALVRGLNERVLSLLRAVSGKDVGRDVKSWTAWLFDLEGFAYRSDQDAEPPTIVEDVPIAYQPAPVLIMARGQVTGASDVSHTQVVIPGHMSNVQARMLDCLAAGTPVSTLRGARPIEALRAGDQVLTQDTSSGALRYSPIVTVYHDPPDQTYRIDLGAESIVATGGHSLWKAGEGWVMARKIKAGDRLRTIGGVVEVVGVSKDKVQPVFNVLLEGGDTICIGSHAVLSHDNRLLNLVDHPFDGIRELAVAGSTRRP